MTDTAEFEAVPQAEIQADLREMFRGAVKMTLESVLEEVVRDMVGAGRWARAGTRKDQRNGSYLRQLLTAHGHIDVAMPRTRHSGSPVDVVGRYQRRSGELDDAITAAYVHGVSTRDVAEITEALTGATVGRSSVSRVTKRLDEHVDALRKTPIVGPMPYLYLDATFVDARWARRVENVSALVAYGVGLDGKRRLLAITIGAQESQESWSELLRQLLDRGLSGVRLVIRDDHKGLAAAARTHLPEAEQQRCIVHLQRNVSTKTPHRLRQAARTRSVERVQGAELARREEAPRATGAHLGQADARGHRVPQERLRGSHALLRVSQGALATHPLDQRPRTIARRNQAPHARRGRVSRPRERAAPHHRRRDPRDVRVGEPALPGHVAARRR